MFVQAKDELALLSDDQNSIILDGSSSMSESVGGILFCLKSYDKDNFRPDPQDGSAPEEWGIFLLYHLFDRLRGKIKEQRGKLIESAEVI